MWQKEPGPVNDHIYFLGTHQLCFYLVRGDDAMIVGGGMSHATPFVEEQLNDLDVDPSRVKYLVLTHSHFDHCGALPYFRARFPNVQVLGSSAAAEVFSKQKVLDYNAKMNDAAAQQENLWHRCLHLCDCAAQLAVDRVVSDGEAVDLGKGIRAEFYEVPGHSKCCLATYIPSLKALFPTDTTPQPVNDWRELSYPSAQYDFESYVASLERLNKFDVEILGLDHYGVLRGEQAREFLRLGLERTLAFRSLVLERYAASRDVDAVAEEVTHEALPMIGLPFITRDLLFVITRAMIRSIVSAA